jgi:hypothetical protein
MMADQRREIVEHAGRFNEPDALNGALSDKIALDSVERPPLVEDLLGNREHHRNPTWERAQDSTASPH